ncbi:MAG: DUF6020 family protein [Solobacterium sp.]|nr:DUF6020 family protein [Solobacterium sp.]
MHLFVLIPLYLIVSCRKAAERKNLILSGLFSLFLTVAFSMREYKVFLDQPLSVYPELLAFWFGMFILLQMILEKTDEFVNRLKKPGDDAPVSRKEYMKLLLICWLPYYILMFPGGIWYDVGGEVEQFFGATGFNNINPFLQTLMIGSFIAFGRLFGSVSIGVGLYIAVQAVFSAFVLSNLMVTITELLHTDRGIAKKCLLLYALVPVYPLFVMAVGKDLNWSMAILLCLTNIICIFSSPDEFFRKPVNMVLFPVSLMLVSLLRNSGLPVAILLAVLSLQGLGLMKGKKTALLSGIGAFAAGILLWNMVLLPGLHVSTVGNAKENFSVPFLQMGRAYKYYPDDFSSEDDEIVGRVVDIDAMRNNYKPNDSDSIKETFKTSATEADISEFTEIYRREMKKRPLCYLDAMAAISYAYYDPDSVGSSKPFAVAGNYAESRFDKIGIEVRYLTDRMPYYVAGIISRSRSVPILGAITKCGVWIWAYLYCFASILKKLPRRYLSLFLPGIIIMIGLMFTPINGYFRYTYPIIAMVPACILVCMSRS